MKKDEFLNLSYSEMLNFINITDQQNSEPITAPAIMEQPINWNNEILELETFFAGLTLPIEQIKIDSCTTIKEVTPFINSHLLVVKANNGNKIFEPYLNRLKQLKRIL